MARSTKAQMIQARAEGKPLPKNEPEEELHELEKQEVQDDILEPTSAEIWFGDEALYLPYEFTLKDIYRNKILNTVRYFYLLMQSELKNIRGAQALAPSDPLMAGILFKPSIQNAMAEMLAIVTKRPIEFFEAHLDDKSTVDVFRWLVKVLTKPSSSSGEPNAKN